MADTATDNIVRTYVGAVGIGVSDLDRSVKFYTETLGMKAMQTFNLDYMNEVVVGYEGRGSAIVLMHWIDGSPRNYKDNPIKIVIYVDSPPALAKAIRDAGYEVVREPVPSPQVGGAVVGFAKDPDGYLIEILQRRKSRAEHEAEAAAKG